MAARSTAGGASLEAFSARLASYRELVLPVLLEAIPNKEPRRHLYDPIRTFVERSGKGLRPALCIATCRAFGGRTPDVLPTAAALELLHNGLLVHDDVEDESEYRRAEPTLHTKHGVAIAVNVGDAVNALTLGLLMKNRERLGGLAAWDVLVEFQHLLLESLEGQAVELGWIRDNDLGVGVDEYLRMILKKTCWYSFIHPCRLGALIAGRRDLERFDRFGFLMGAAFQIQDDLLNLLGEGKIYGKEIGGDLWEGKRTLILAHALERASGADRERVQKLFAQRRTERSAREVGWLAGFVRESGSLEQAARAARELATAAARQFELAFEPAPESEDKAFVRALPEYVIAREL
jgi:geranylgeranyl diphosphate synthase type II